MGTSVDLIRGFCGKLRSLAVTLDGETARLQRALDGEDSDFEDYPLRVLHALHSEVRTLKDDVSTLLEKARLGSQDSIGFIKATKVLMKKNSVDIMKIREVFRKYGYTPRAKSNSADEPGATDAKPEATEQEDPERPAAAVPGPSVSAPSPRSPQLSDFGLERYMISPALPNPPRSANNAQEEPDTLSPFSKQALVQSPRCALKMDDFECVTPKLEHFGVSEYTMCLNEDYTVARKHVKSNSEEAKETKPVTHDHFFAAPGLITQPPEQNDADCTHSPLAPTFCTPGLKIPSTNHSTALVSANYPSSKANRSSCRDLEMKERASLAAHSEESFENFADPSSPTISAYENLLRTPTPPEVTAIPEDIRQILSKYNSNLATPTAVKPVPPGKVFLPRREGQNTRDAGNKENRRE